MVRFTAVWIGYPFLPSHDLPHSENNTREQEKNKYGTKKKKISREHSVVPERVPVPQVLETLGRLYETHVRPLVVLAGPSVELEEVRHRAL